ncbi:MAG: thioesterase, partial [Planktomarina sp.]|nr:thioesterase [Planktomarina sp.]
EFLAPARMGDKLRVETDVLSGSHVRLILQQNVWRKTHLIFRSKVTIVLIGGDGKLKKLPAKIRQISQL